MRCNITITQELADERGRLVQWQEGLGPGGADSGTGGGDGGSGRDQGDELDYEDEADDEAPPAGSAEGKTQQAGRPGEPGAEAGGLSGSSEQAEGKERSTTGAGAAGDEASSKSHPDYFGRGWWPSAKGQRQSSGPATAAASAAVGGAAGGGESGGSNGDGNGNGRGAEDAAGIYAEGGKCDEPIAAPCGEVEGAAEAAECIVEQQPGADGGVKSIISSGLSGSNPADAPEPLVPMPAPAPRPRSLVPVKVSFTPLETPHLPAREQREEELRLHKKGADAQVRRCAAWRSTPFRCVPQNGVCIGPASLTTCSIRARSLNDHGRHSNHPPGARPPWTAPTLRTASRRS